MNTRHTLMVSLGIMASLSSLSCVSQSVGPDGVHQKAGPYEQSVGPDGVKQSGPGAHQEVGKDGVQQGTH
ncbi:MAG: hypothetical protein ACSHXK_16155 [Oceanococcus sp.]